MIGEIFGDMIFLCRIPGLRFKPPGNSSTNSTMLLHFIILMKQNETNNIYTVNIYLLY